MLSRRRLALLAPAAVLTAALVGAVVYAEVRSDPRAAVGGPFALQDGAGHTVTDAQFRGRWMLVYFGYTHCPDVCPTTLQDIVAALSKLTPAQRHGVAALFITVDPERDTPALMQQYAAAFGSDIVGLSGSLVAVASVAREYRVYYAKHPVQGGYEMDHSSVIYLMDPNGRFVATFTPSTTPDQIAARLKDVV